MLKQVLAARTCSNTDVIFFDSGVWIIKPLPIRRQVIKVCLEVQIFLNRRLGYIAIIYMASSWW